MLPLPPSFALYLVACAGVSFCLPLSFALYLVSCHVQEFTFIPCFFLLMFRLLFFCMYIWVIRLRRIACRLGLYASFLARVLPRQDVEVLDGLWIG